MKKIIFAFIFFSLLSNLLKSQITKNNWMLGGVINYSSIQRNSENYGPSQIGYRLNFSPNVGYFIWNKFSIGIKTGFNKEGVKPPGTSTYNKYTDFNIGPYTRYYFLNTQKNINIFSEAAYQYGFEKGNQDDPVSKNTFIFSAGPVFYFNSVVGLEFLISYSTSKFSGIKGRNNIILIGAGLQVHLEKEK